MAFKIRPRRKGEKKSEYFANLSKEGFVPPSTVSGVSGAEVDRVLAVIGLNRKDLVDVVCALLDDSFPNVFNPQLPITAGAGIAHIGSYVGMLVRRGNKMDREGRDHWVKPLWEVGVVEKVTYNSKSSSFLPGHIKAKSPNSAYRVSAEFLAVLKSNDHLAAESFFYQDEQAKRLKRRAEIEKQIREQHGAGAHHDLILLSIEQYARVFLPSYTLLYKDDADGDRITKEEQILLKEAGVSITLSDSWPDVILIDSQENKLWFIEAVISDGEVDETKMANLKLLCEKNQKLFGGATTTYLDWKVAARRQGAYKNLAINSYVWIATDGAKTFFISSSEDKEFFGTPTKGTLT